MRAEEELLALLWHMQGAATTTQVLVERGAKEFEDGRDIQAHIAWLAAAGDIVQSDADWTIAPAARERAAGFGKQLMIRSFDKSLLQHADSATYREYCRRTYGVDRFQFNIVDAPQAEALIEVLRLSPGDRFADLGCATGTMTQWIREQTGAAGLGIDVAPTVIARATAEYADDERLAFQVGDLDALDLPPLDAVVAIDTLYFARSLGKTLDAMLAALKPGGRFVAFFTAGTQDEGLGLEEMRIGKALIARGLPPQGIDFTREGQALWSRAVQACIALEAAFRKEGNADLWERRTEEATGVLRKYESGSVRRWLVYADAP